MSEAEKKWDIFDKQNGYPFKSKQSREAYKAALRMEIEKRQPHDGPTAMMSVYEFMRLLDTVEP